DRPDRCRYRRHRRWDRRPRAGRAGHSRRAGRHRAGRAPPGRRPRARRALRGAAQLLLLRPAAARNALSVQGKDIDVDTMAKQMGTTEAGTNSINDITPVLNKETGKADAYRSVEIRTGKADDKQTKTLRADIVRTIDDGRAVVANIAGTATDTDGVSHSFAGGHYISVVGYRDNGDVVKIADSANPDQASYWITVDHLADWIATRGYATS
ncbi:LOW QUALITY PROTEIN: hypothetical protein MCAG_03509, partial [Micromonospora sp. ATCC 39149]